MHFSTGLRPVRPRALFQSSVSSRVFSPGHHSELSQDPEDLRQLLYPEQEQWERCYHWPSHPRCSLKRPGCFSCRSASTAGLRHFGKTCELWMLGRINRTCAAGLRHSVRPANCKCSPPTGFEVPNVGHPFLFLFLFPHVSFHSHSSFFNARSQRGFFKPERRPPAATPLLFVYGT